MGEAGQVPGVGWQSLALSFVSLGAVCIVAWAALKLLAARGVGKAAGAVRVVARCPLEPRRSVYVIEAAGRCFLVGVGDGPMSMLAELDAAAVSKSEASAPPRFANPGFANSNSRFADVLAKVMGRPRPASRAPGIESP
ncbi:MAG TPA: flagellar biosynthetic protein FliO [Polyangia bacterium]|jgi:flagellar biosynthetic protein FliO|nr:flagellar biosynthetic protein FliO [Polyangia bacterium]